MLREMESQFGLPLVERSRRGVVLTNPARVALRRFRIALAEIEASHREASRAGRAGRAQLRLGALTVAMLDLVPQALARFIAAFEPVELDVIVGRIGLSWARSPEGAQLDQVKLFDEPRCIVCRSAHPIARLGVPDLQGLATATWVLQPVPSSSRQAFEEMFLARGLMPPVPTVEAVSAHSCLDIVSRTDLLSVSPRALARRQAESGRVLVLDAPPGLAGMAISAIWRRSGAADPLVSGFRSALVAVSSAA
jgi:DNA-binding transcriptional LysR family regulator